MPIALIFDSVGAGEWLVLLAVLLIFVGPRRLPEAARTFGRYYNRFRRAADSFKRQLMEMDSEIDEVMRETQASASKTIDELQEQYKDVRNEIEEVPDADAGNGASEPPEQEEELPD